MYAIPALSLTNRQVKELYVFWNNVIRRVFGYHKWESASALLLSLERLNVRYLILLRKVTFLCSNRNEENMLKTVFSCRFAL